MRNFVFGIISSICVFTLLGATARRHTYTNRKLQEEFDAIYYEMQYNNHFINRTTSELQLMSPSREGEYYWNTTTNELWISSGTSVNQWVHK